MQISSSLTRTLWWICLIALALVTVGVLFGTDTGGDATRYVGKGRNAILAMASFELPELNDPWDYFYLIPNIAIASQQMLLGAYSFHSTIVVNFVLFLICSCFVYQIWIRMWSSRSTVLVPIVVGVMIIVGLPGEVSKYVFVSHSSDVMFLCLEAWFFYSLYRILAGNGGGPLLSLGTASVGLALTRPVGVVFLVLAISVISYRHRKHFFTVLVCLLVVSLGVAFLIWPYCIQRIIESQRSVSYGLRLVLENYQSGVIVSGRDYMNVGSPTAYLDYVWITISRFFWYFIPFRSGFSMAHLIYNSIYISTVFILVVFGVRRTKRELSSLFNLLLLATIVLLGCFHSMTQVEDWRYALPIWVPLWILAGIGVAELSAVRGSKNTQSEMVAENGHRE